MSDELDWYDEILDESRAHEDIERFWNRCIDEFEGEPDEA